MQMLANAPGFEPASQQAAVDPTSNVAAQHQRRSSMQDAADAMMWDTFHLPGPTEPVMLPPQPSRIASLGQPLQLVDSNQYAPYIGKGKGRARDLETNQQPPHPKPLFNMQPDIPLHQHPNPTASQSLPLPGALYNTMPAPDQNPSTFDFNHASIDPAAWLPLSLADFQHQPATMNPASDPFHCATIQAHPHAHPPPYQPPATQMSISTPLHEPFLPPPGFPQAPHSPGWAFFPGAAGQQAPSGYSFRPGRGFVCRVCGFAMRQPGIHRAAGGGDGGGVSGGSGGWCWADGPGMREEVGAEAGRRGFEGSGGRRRGRKRGRFI